MCVNPGQELAYTELFRADTVERRERPVEDMVYPLVFSALLQGDQGIRLFDDADELPVPAGIGSDVADLPFGEVEANGAEADFQLHVEDALG